MPASCVRSGQARKQDYKDKRRPEIRSRTSDRHHRRFLGRRGVRRAEGPHDAPPAGRFLNVSRSKTGAIRHIFAPILHGAEPVPAGFLNRAHEPDSAAARSLRRGRHNEATVKRDHYDRHEQLEHHLNDFINAYNFDPRLKTLKGLTPYEFIVKTWTNQPQQFQIQSNPSNAGTKHLSSALGRRHVLFRLDWAPWAGQRQPPPSGVRNPSGGAPPGVLPF